MPAGGEIKIQPERLSMAEHIALIAGAGRLPVLVAQSARQQHKQIFIVALKGITDPAWVVDYPHRWVGLAKLGQLYEIFKTEQITHAVMAGHVRRPAFSELIPDWTGWKAFRRLRRLNGSGDDAVLRFLAADIEAQGVHVIGADQIAGRLTRDHKNTRCCHNAPVTALKPTMNRPCLLASATASGAWRNNACPASTAMPAKPASAA